MKLKDFINEVNKIGLTVFSLYDLKRIFPKEALSMPRVVNRLIKADWLKPVYRGRYRLAETQIDIEKEAQQIYYPSYISFESALFKYGVIDQGSYTVSLATTRHGKRVAIDGRECLFRQIKPALFFGFNLTNGIYIAEVEKAILDTLYFVFLGKLKIETQDWYFKEVDSKKIKKYAQVYGNAFFQYAGKVLKF